MDSTVLFLKECSRKGEPLLPMKVVQESGSAQTLLLITDTSQSNSLWSGGGGREDSGERSGEPEGWQDCSSSQGATL